MIDLLVKIDLELFGCAGAVDFDQLRRRFDARVPVGRVPVADIPVVVLDHFLVFVGERLSDDGLQAVAQGFERFGDVRAQHVGHALGRSLQILAQLRLEHRSLARDGLADDVFRAIEVRCGFRDPGVEFQARHWALPGKAIPGVLLDERFGETLSGFLRH